MSPHGITIYPEIELTHCQCSALVEVVRKITRPLGGIDEPSIRPLCRMDRTHVLWSKTLGPIEPEIPLRQKVALIRRLEARGRKARN